VARLTAGAGAGLAVLSWRAAYPGTGALMALVAVTAVAGVCGYPGRTRWLALRLPGWFIGVAGAAVWLDF
jgi:hypothetical protein